MKSLLFLAALMTAAGPPESRPGAPPNSNPAIEGKTDTATSQADEGKNKPATIQPLTVEQLKKLLAKRLDGEMGFSFRQFSNMFLVSSRLQLGVGVGIMSSDEEMFDLPLASPFPSSYQPTIREFLDSIALQTSSEWKYDPSSKYLQSESNDGKLVKDLAIFEFTVVKREKPFKVTLANGWKTVDKGSWVMHVPPDFPIAMDIYEMGTYSLDVPEQDKDFSNTIRSAVSLEWAHRVNKDAVEKDFEAAKVGKFDALFYKTTVRTQTGEEFRWRQWVLMDGNRCYFIVSTIMPEKEDKILPDVKKMLASFVIKKKQ